MKKLTAILAVTLLTSFTFAQKVKETEVPSVVKESFNKKYPGVKAEWEKESSDYEAEFKQNKIEMSAVFDSNGTFKEVEQEIKTSELPQSVTEYCTKNFSGYKLDEATKITDASGKVWYEVVLEKGKEEMDAIFDDQGNFVKKSEESGKENDKD